MCEKRIMVVLLALSLCSGCADTSDYAFLKAVDAGDTNVIALVVRERGSINALISMGHDEGEGTLLHIASKDGNLEFVRALLDQGANVNATNSLGLTPLMAVVEGGEDEVQSELISVLLQRGADPSLGTPERWNALMRAGNLGRAAYVELLLHAGADPRDATSSGNTALHAANSSRVAALLVEAGAEVNATNHAGETPLDVVQRLGSTRTAIEELKKRGGTNSLRHAVPVAPPGSDYRLNKEGATSK